MTDINTTQETGETFSPNDEQPADGCCGNHHDCCDKGESHSDGCCGKCHEESVAHEFRPDLTEDDKARISQLIHFHRDQAQMALDLIGRPLILGAVKAISRRFPVSDTVLDIGFGMVCDTTKPSEIATCDLYESVRQTKPGEHVAFDLLTNDEREFINLVREVGRELQAFAVSYAHHTNQMSLQQLRAEGFIRPVESSK